MMARMSFMGAPGGKAGFSTETQRTRHSWRTAPRERAEGSAPPSTYSVIGRLGALTRGRSPRLPRAPVVNPGFWSAFYHRRPAGQVLVADWVVLEPQAVR